MGYLYESPGPVREVTQTQSTVSRGFSPRGAQNCLRQEAGIAFDYGFEKRAFSDASFLRLAVQMVPLFEVSFSVANF